MEWAESGIPVEDSNGRWQRIKIKKIHKTEGKITFKHYVYRINHARTYIDCGVVVILAFEFGLLVCLTCMLFFSDSES